MRTIDIDCNRFYDCAFVEDQLNQKQLDWCCRSVLGEKVRNKSQDIYKMSKRHCDGSSTTGVSFSDDIMVGVE